MAIMRNSKVLATLVTLNTLYLKFTVIIYLSKICNLLELEQVSYPLGTRGSFPGSKAARVPR